MAVRPRRIALPPGVKPCLPVEVDWQHPLLRGVRIYYPVLEAGGNRSLVLTNRIGIDYATLPASSTAELVIDRLGPALRPNGLTTANKRDGLYVYDHQAWLGGLTELTAIVTLRQGIANPARVAFVNASDDLDSATSRAIQFIRVPGTTQIRAISTTFWGAGYDVNWPQIATTEPITIAFTWRSGDLRRVYAGFVGSELNQVGQHGPFTGTTAYNTNSYCTIGGNLTDGSVIYFAAVYGRQLTLKELRAIHADPYAPIRRRRVLVPVASGTTADLSGAAQSSATGQASLTADVPISGAAVSVASASGWLVSSVPLTGFGAAASIGSASLQAGADLSGDAKAQATGSGSVALSVRLDGAAVAAAIAQAALSAGVDLSGQAAAGAGGAGALSTGSDLSGAAQGQAAGSGSITIQVTLDGKAVSEALASAGIDAGSGDLSGAAAAGASGAAAMIMDVPVAGSAASVSSADGSLSAILPLEAVAVSGSSATGGLTVQARLDGQAVANAMASGVLAVDAGSTLGGDAVAESAGSGVLSLRLTLNGAALAEAVASAMLAGTLDALVVRRWTVSAVRRDFTVRARG